MIESHDHEEYNEGENIVKKYNFRVKLKRLHTENNDDEIFTKKKDKSIDPNMTEINNPLSNSLLKQEKINEKTIIKRYKTLDI